MRNFYININEKDFILKKRFEKIFFLNMQNAFPRMNLLGAFGYALEISNLYLFIPVSISRLLSDTVYNLLKSRIDQRVTSYNTIELKIEVKMTRRSDSSFFDCEACKSSSAQWSGAHPSSLKLFLACINLLHSTRIHARTHTYTHTATTKPTFL